MFQHLDAHTIYGFIAGFALLFTSALLFQKSKRWAIIVLVIASFVLGWTMASIDPFLNLWDEQQHALVAKNLANNPLMPLLYTDHIYDYDYKNWVGNQVWVHKQPLFLWQMALSIKLFGANVIAVRLPSIILHALLTYVVYRIGKAIKNERLGFIAAILITVAHFPLELVAGRYSTDHNDFSFLFYTAWGIMCWLEYQKSKEKKWLIWLGISAGCAVLVKWMMGLIIYVCWFLVITIKNNFKIYQIKNYFVLIKPFLISLAVFLPWQIYTFMRFPKESAYEFSASGKHFLSVVEGHGGEWYYHFDEGFDLLYFSTDSVSIILLIIISLGLFFIKKNIYRLMFGIYIFFVYTFYSIAATKMPAFTIICMPLVFTCVAVVIEKLYSLIETRTQKPFISWMIIVLLISYPSFATMRFGRIEDNHSKQDIWTNADRQLQLKEINIINTFQEKYGKEGYVIFNANLSVVGHIPFMFHTDNIAYPFEPTDEMIDQSIQKGYKVVIIDDHHLEKKRRNSNKVSYFILKNDASE